MVSRLLAILLVAAGMLSAQAGIEGTILNSATRAGIEGVTLRFYTQQGTVYETISTGGGAFRIQGVQPGNYRVRGNKPGFVEPRTEFPKRDAVMRVADKETARVTLEMLPLTSLSGRVFDPGNKPASDVVVQLVGPTVKPGVTSEIVSDREGRFRFEELLPGRFTLFAKPKPEGRTDSDGVRMEAVTTYYPSSIESGQAQFITVRGDTEEAGFEIHLQRRAVYHVRGVVLDEEGHPAADVKVGLTKPVTDPSNLLTSNIGNISFYLLAPTFALASEELTTGREGTFDFPSVLDGDWRVRASTDWVYREDTKQEVQKVGQADARVSRKDEDRLEIRLRTNFDLPVTLEWPQQNPSSQRNFAMIALVPTEGGELPAPLTINRDSRWNFERVYPGSYRVIPQWTSLAGSYVAQVLVDGQDALNASVTLSASTQPMRIVFKQGAGSVRGTIEKSAAATVVLVPGVNQAGVTSSMEVAAGDVFEFSNLRPGDYMLAAFDRVAAPKLSRPDTLRDLAVFAKSVKVEENGQLAVELPVNRWPD